MEHGYYNVYDQNNKDNNEFTMTCSWSYKIKKLILREWIYKIIHRMKLIQLRKRMIKEGTLVVNKIKAKINYI